MPNDETPPDKNDRDFFRVVQVGSALGIGSMAGFLYSLKQVHPSVRLELGVGTLLTFLGAATFSWILCGMLARAGAGGAAGTESFETLRHRKSLRRWMVVFLTVCALATVAAFGYSLKDVSAESRRDVLEGTLIACLVLAVGGWLIRKAFRFFEEHSEAELEQLREDREDEDR